jgi:hypothetical protein
MLVDLQLFHTPFSRNGSEPEKGVHAALADKDQEESGEENESMVR